MSMLWVIKVSEQQNKKTTLIQRCSAVSVTSEKLAPITNMATNALKKIIDF